MLTFTKTGEGKDPWGKYRMGGETTFTIKRSDFGITFMKDGLSDDVTLMLAFEGVREEAKLGARTTLEVLDAEQDLLDARAARFQSEAERYYSYYNLLAATGQLTVEKLNLGIPTYDVSAYYNAVKDAPSTSYQGRALDRVLKAIGEE